MFRTRNFLKHMVWARYVSWVDKVSLNHKGILFWNKDMELVQGIKVFAAKPEDLSSIPRTHTVEGKNQLPKVVLWL